MRRNSSISSSSAQSREVRRFFAKLSAFAASQLLVFIVLWAGLQAFQFRYRYDNSQTEACVRVTPKDQKFDLVFIGSSRARSLSRNGNHALVEKILNAKVLNISRAAGGVVPEYVYLSYFYDRGNAARKLVYFVDPFGFFSPQYNENNEFAEIEPLQPLFLWEMIKAHIAAKQIYRYLENQISWFMFSEKPVNAGSMEDQIQKIDPEAIRKRMGSLYFDGADPALFASHAPYLRKILDLALSRGTEQVYLIFAPTRITKEPGAETVLGLIRQTLADPKYQGKVHFVDHREAMPGLLGFRDHDHMNTVGVVNYTQRYLRKVLSE